MSLFDEKSPFSADSFYAIVQRVTWPNDRKWSNSSLIAARASASTVRPPDGSAMAGAEIHVPWTWTRLQSDPIFPPRRPKQQHRPTEIYPNPPQRQFVPGAGPLVRDDNGVPVDRQLRRPQSGDRAKNRRRCAVPDLQQEGASLFGWHGYSSFHK